MEVNKKLNNLWIACFFRDILFYNISLFTSTLMLMNLKKLFLLNVLVLSTLVFSACSSAPRAVFMEFKVTDGEVQKEYYSEINLKLVPDYEKRILTVDFSRVFPNRTEATEGPDMVVQGASIGGENFENFVVGVEMIADNLEVGAKIDEVKPVFEVKMQDEKAKSYNLKMNWEQADVNYEPLKNFYLDVTGLMTQEEQV